MILLVGMIPGMIGEEVPPKKATVEVEPKYTESISLYFFKVPKNIHSSPTAHKNESVVDTEMQKKPWDLWTISGTMFEASGIWGHPPHTQVCCSGFNNEWVIFAQPWVRQNDDTHIVVIKNKHRKHPFLPTADGGPNGWGWKRRWRKKKRHGIVTLYRGLFYNILIIVDQRWSKPQEFCILLLYSCIHICIYV